MANIDSEVLAKCLVQVRRVAESREEGTEKEIRRLYKALIKDLNGFLGNEYIKYSDEDERLTYGILQVKGEYARFSEEVNKKVEGILPEVKEVVNGLVNDTYEKCYDGMVEGVKRSATAEALQNEFKSVKAVRPEVIKAAVQNPIPKLRLTPTLERCRKNVISNIKREIGIGLSQGDRISTMAKRINNRVDISYRQSMLIARTEAHRVRETGLNDAANEVDEILKANGSEYRKIKIWNTSGDKAVRDTHAKMDGVAVLQDEKFELPSGATAECPGTSGVASEDCNCRCFLTHDIVTDEEFYAMTGRHFSDYEDLTGDKSNDKIELTKYIGKEITETDNQHIKEWYVANVSDIPNQIDTSKPTEEQARQAFELRNKYKSEARAAMSDKEMLENLNKKYPAPTFEKLLAHKINNKNMTYDEAVTDILKSVSTTNKDVNDKFGL